MMTFASKESVKFNTINVTGKDVLAAIREAFEASGTGTASSFELAEGQTLIFDTVAETVFGTVTFRKKGKDSQLPGVVARINQAWAFVPMWALRKRPASPNASTWPEELRNNEGYMTFINQSNDWERYGLLAGRNFTVHEVTVEETSSKGAPYSYRVWTLEEVQPQPSTTTRGRGRGSSR